MPITTGALRKMRADAKKAKVNFKVKRAAKEAVTSMRKKPSAGNLSNVFKSLDKAVKKNVIHKNKAARLKSRLTSLVKK